MFSVEELTKILAGIPINPDSVFILSDDPIVADLIGRNATVLSEWALIAAGDKRIAITNLGRRIWIRVDVDPNQADDIVRHAGWRISLSRQYVSGLNRL